eukprot:7309671-Heterocapsa_arctica.AAC.1
MPPLMWPLPNWKLLASCVATASNKCASHAPRPADCDLARAPFLCHGPSPGVGRSETGLNLTLRPSKALRG